jgi:bacteriocin-like protein
MTTSIRELTIDELDTVSGGIEGYKECVMGTTAGGPPGLYGNDADCSQGGWADLMNAFHKGVRQGVQKGGGKA